ncbi:hypothetical protein LPTSP3_g06310 [Leptospira kobayashii]|uniref:Membrane protein 6-pyruvoyl-tetrahydropterin synthase-related domain-containing protein n=1 Tax=Leptospira kobayashii TaxID=1917830 RepID=A0ABM7UGN4_9LEPT|nr:hypothetical protein [Leptospira kobayashii]BDA77701.1 hypothetical protein LPTSP3_g06310 [Leptospira kobayashii]
MKSNVIKIGSVFFLGLLFLWKFSNYLTGTEPIGWDTGGHYQLANVYRESFASFNSLAWDEGWFGGFAAFYFYPPFFYFLTNIISIFLPVNFPFAFGFGIFLIIPLLAYAIIRFLNVFVLNRFPLSYQLPIYGTSVLFYFSYSGDGLQGTSAIGMQQGTFISSLAHGFLLISLSHLEVFRKTKSKEEGIKFILISSLLIYTHFLTSFFWGLAVLLHLIVFRKDWFRNFKYYSSFFVAILILSFPVLYNYLKFSEYTSGVFYGYTYPPLLSILGKDAYDVALASTGNGENFLVAYIRELLLSGRVVSLFLLFGFISLCVRYLKHRNGRRYATIFTFFFLWLSLDNTFGYIIPGLMIHNYRAFDSAFLGFSMLSVLGAFHILIRWKWKLPVQWGLVFLFLFTLRNFIFFQPKEVSSDRDVSQEMEFHLHETEKALEQLPKGSLVFPEIVRTSVILDTPHFWSNLLRKHGLRNALGLTVESSLYPTLAFNWEEFGLAHTFRWGTNVSWKSLWASSLTGDNRNGELPEFLRRSGVKYLTGHTAPFYEFIKIRNNDFKILFQSGPFLIVELLYPSEKPNLPGGYLSYSWLQSKTAVKPDVFLRDSNTILARLVSHNISIRIVNLESSSELSDEDLKQNISFLFLSVDSKYRLDGISYAKSFAQKGIHVVLLGVPAPPNDPYIWDWSPDIEKRIAIHLKNSQVKTNPWKFHNMGYFPELKESSGISLYQSDSHQIAVINGSGKINVSLSGFRSKWITWALILLPVFYLLAPIIRKTRYLLFS